MKIKKTNKKKKKKKNDICAKSMAKAILVNNSRKFWTEVKKKLYNSVPYDEEEMKSLCNIIDTNVVSNCVGGRCYNKHTVTIDDVCQSIRKLKNNKSDCKYKAFSCNLLNAPHMSFVLLSLLFQCMLSHGIIPEDMGLGNITPIIKNKCKSCNDSNNYRAITLSSILGKLFDYIILTQNSSVPSTCDLQFGFKSKHSTVQCSFALKEIVQYYSNNKSNVYCLLLDATQAFDGVHYIKLFNTLTRRGMCSLTVRFLIKLYTQQKLRVKWENTFSPEFCLKMA